MAKSEIAQTSDTVLSKPQIDQTDVERHSITKYTVIPGDTVSSVSTRFDVSPQTIKWSNQLVSDALAPGKILLIPGVNGVIHTVKSGESLDSIAEKYSASKQRIVTYNDLEISGLVIDQQIVLPDGILPLNERPENIANNRSNTNITRATSSSTASLAVGNKYDYGYCTWYAYNRRAELGRTVGSFWGNASTWAMYARAAGYRVDKIPEIGAVMQDSYSAGGYGHVAIVESKGEDGSIVISEMNYAGWNRYSTRTLDAGQASAYNYIH